jgi:hypothetical protein
MKRIMFTLLVFALVFIGLGLNSCGETPLATQEQTPFLDANGIDRVCDSGIIQSVSGSGHWIDEATARTVTFTIRKYADGSVRGWYQASTHGPGGAQIRVSVDCLHVVGNQAWAGGVIVSAGNPNNIGHPVSLRFIDNGEGVNMPPDEFGGVWTEYDCATEPELSTRQLTIGNLQVRG